MTAPILRTPTSDEFAFQVRAAAPDVADFLLSVALEVAGPNDPAGALAAANAAYATIIGALALLRVSRTRDLRQQGHSEAFLASCGIGASHSERLSADRQPRQLATRPEMACALAKYAHLLDATPMLLAGLEVLISAAMQHRAEHAATRKATTYA